jgi:hypothetical protein
MAVHKAIRSNPAPQPERPRPNHQLKAELFETLRHLNRGYGVALAAIDKLEGKSRNHGPRIFPTGFLHGYRTRTEVLRAETKRDLLRIYRRTRRPGRSSLHHTPIARVAKNAKS